MNCRTNEVSLENVASLTNDRVNERKMALQQGPFFLMETGLSVKWGLHLLPNVRQFGFVELHCIQLLVVILNIGLLKRFFSANAGSYVG